MQVIRGVRSQPTDWIRLKHRNVEKQVECYLADVFERLRGNNLTFNNFLVGEAQWADIPTLLRTANLFFSQKARQTLKFMCTRFSESTTIGVSLRIERPRSLKKEIEQVEEMFWRKRRGYRILQTAINTGKNVITMEAELLPLHLKIVFSTKCVFIMYFWN